MKKMGIGEMEEEVPPEPPEDPKTVGDMGGWQRLVQYPFNRVKKDNVEGWYLDWAKAPGTIWFGAVNSQDINDVQNGDSVADSQLNMTPYWKVTWVDPQAGRVYVDPVEPNPFISGVGAGGKQIDEHDYDVFSGEHEKKRTNQVLDDIRNGHVSDYRDVAYLLKGTVPTQMGPNGAQGGWYNAEDLRSNRGGQQGMTFQQIMMADAKALQKLGFPVPPKALDGTMEPQVWQGMMSSSDMGYKKTEDAYFPGENWKDPYAASSFALNHPLPQVKFRNVKALINMLNPYPREEISQASREGNDALYDKLREDFQTGKYERPDLQPFVHDIAKQIATLEHPVQKRLNFDPYYLTKEQLILTAKKYGWQDILQLYETAFDPDNRRYVVDAYKDAGDVQSLLRMEKQEKNPEVLAKLLYALDNLEYPAEQLLGNAKYQALTAPGQPNSADEYHRNELRTTINGIKTRAKYKRQASVWVHKNCKFAK